MKNSPNNKKRGSIIGKISTVSTVPFSCLVLSAILNVVVQYVQTKKEINGMALSFWLNLVILLIATVVGIVIIKVVKKTIISPIDAIRDKVVDISNGSILGKPVEVTNNDELGELAVAVNRMTDYNQSIITDIKYTAEQIAAQNLMVKPKAEYTGDYIPIKNALESVIESMNEIVADVEVAAEEVKSNSSQMSVNSDVLSRAAHEETEIVNALHSNLDSVHISINESADKATEAKQMCDRMVTAINEGNEKMASMLAAMDEINQTSSEIANIIKTIDDISFQTNILALNASIEAARAGDAGRGFAVVANEVSSLATMTAEAAKSTTGLIKKSLSAVSNGSNIADETAKMLSDVIGMMEQSSTAISHIADTSVQQADSIKSVVNDVDRISTTVNEINSSAENCTASANALTMQSAMLYDTIDGFIKDGKFERKSKTVSTPVKEIRLDDEPEQKPTPTPTKPVAKAVAEKPKTSATKPISTPTVEKKSEEKPKATPAKPEPKAVAEKPKTSTTKPISTPTAEKKTEKKPKATPAKPESKAVAEKPKTSATKPISTPTAEKKTEEKPKASPAKPEPKAVAEKPKVSTTKPISAPTAEKKASPINNSVKPKTITLDEDEEKAAQSAKLNKSEKPKTSTVKPEPVAKANPVKPQSKAETAPKPAPSRTINLDDADTVAPSTPAKVVTKATMAPVKHTINLEKEKY